MVISVNIHPQSGRDFRARVDGSDSTRWLTIGDGFAEVVIFASRDQVEKLQMAADILNDAFACHPEPAPAATADPDDDGIPF